MIHEKIKELREAAGWSQSELARQTRLSSAAISMIEKGEGGRKPSIVALTKIAKALNVSLLTIIGGNTIEENNKIAQEFFTKFADIRSLNDADQNLILTIIKRLKEDC